MKRRSSIWIMFLTVVLIMFLAACSTPAGPEVEDTPAATEEDGADAPTAAAEEPAEEDPAEAEEEGEPVEITIALNGEPNTLDPVFAAGRLSQAFLANIYDGLTAHKQDGTLEPALAVSWEALDDNTWQFKLREGVTFHNGEAFTAASVKASLDRIFDPANESPMIGRVGEISEVEVVDDFTVNITTETPDVLLPVRLSELYGSVVPAQYVAEVGTEGFADAPVGTGPFKFVEWVPNQHIVLEANEDYWRGAPAVDRITVYPITEDAARMAALQTGEVDIVSNVPAFQVAELEAAGLQIATVPSTRFFFLVMRTDMPPFDDVRVRQALNYALDVPALIDAVQFGLGDQLATVVIPQAFGYDPSIEPYPHDLERARELLAEAGYPDGFDATFDAFTGSIVDHTRVAEAVAGQLSEAGMRFELNVTEFGVFSPLRLDNDTAPLYIYSFGDWALDGDNSFYLLLQGQSGYYYDNEEAVELYEQERGTFDLAEREALLKELQQLFKEDAPYGYLYQIDTIWGLQENINYVPRTDELTWFYEISVR